MRKNTQWYYRWAPSLGGGFSGTPEKVWRVKKYNSKKHLNEPTVFCGLYGLPDFMAFRQHKGEKMIWYAGSDIRHLIAGYWIDEVGKIRVDPKPFCEYLSKYDNYVENEVEYEALKKWGIEAKIVPSFLGNVNDFQPQELSKELRYYSSVSNNDFSLYGWDRINLVAGEMPEAKFYLYGNTIPWEAPKNVIVRGRMSQEEMNNEIKSMTGAIRMTEFDGFSEIICKSILWGQKPISLIDYPLLRAENPREALLRVLNKYPWNVNI